jgi:hypothetical protein
MRLSRIEIENFKGIGTKQVIDLAPITLLFGPNSAGKSTILQSVHYLREVLTRANADPDFTTAGGLIDLGGFANLIHSHDLNRTMKIKLVIKGIDGLGSDRLPLNSGASLGSPEFANLPIRYIVGENTNLKDYSVVQTIGVSLSVAWSAFASAPYVSAVTVEIDGADIATITSPAQPGRAILSNFNFEHPLLAQYRDKDTYGRDYDDDDAFCKCPLADEVLLFSREMAKSADVAMDDYRIGVETVLGALPEIDAPLVCDLRDPDASNSELELNAPRVRGLMALLDELMLGPLRLTRDYLNQMTYIGPLRDIPSRGFRPRLSPDDSRWSTGLAAWDLLYSDAKGDLLKSVNRWLGDKDKLGINYEIVRLQHRKIPLASRINQIFERGLNEDDLAELQEDFSRLDISSEIRLRDFVKNLTLAPIDVGVGISQVIPVVVGCIQDQDGILAIEQPELHIHPAIQVGLGDLFIDAIQAGEESTSAGKSLLIETHSEHIMLRLLRRIRENTANVVPPGAKGAHTGQNRSYLRREPRNRSHL